MTTELEDYEKVDLGIAFTRVQKNLTIFANVHNVLGQDIENLDDSHTILDGEPTFRAGAAWEF